MAATLQIDTVLGSNGDTLILVSDDEIEASPPPPVVRRAPPRATIKKMKVVPFSRADYARRRQHHTDEERALRIYLQRVFRRKFSWNRIRFLVWMSGGRNPYAPIVIE